MKLPLFINHFKKSHPRGDFSLTPQVIVLVIFLALFSLPILWPLFRPGFFQSDDGEWMIIRFSAFHQALVDGQFPVRWLGRLNHEYGYPVANFLYPGFMYLAEIPKILGFGFVDSVKIILGFSMMGSAIFTYLWLAKFFGRWEAVVGGLFYLYAPYHLFDLYKRGSVGEILALAVVPFILWQVERKSFFLTTIGVALLILSHNTLALLFLPTILLYGISRSNIRDWRKLIYQYTSILVVSVGLASFFWIPAILDLRYTKFSQIQVSNWQDYFVGFGLIGWGNLVVLAIAFFFFILPKVIRIRRSLFYSNYLDNRSKLFYFFLILGLGAIFLSLSQSRFLWQILPVGFIQFPFRFLAVATLATAFLATWILNGLKGKTRWGLGIILVTTLLVSTTPYTKPTGFFDKGEGFYATNEGTTTVQNEYMPKWVKALPTERPEKKIEVLKTEALWKIENLAVNSSRITFQTQNASDLLLQANVVYFPGWQVFVDGGKVPINPNNPQGLMQFRVPTGNHYVEVKFTRTPLRLFSELISLISFAVLLSLIVRTNKLRR